MDRTIGGINARNRCTGHRRFDAGRRVVMPITKITSNERGKPTAQPTVFVRLDVAGCDNLFRNLLFFVFDAPCGGCGAPSCQTTWTNFAPCSRKMRCTPRMV